MLKKTKTAVITALATMLSTISPLAAFAENPVPAETIPERAVTQELHTCVDVPEVLDGEPAQTTAVSTIPERVYTNTSVPALGVQPEEFPLERNYDITVTVVDTKTSEHIDGVKVHLVETESLTSSVIRRDFGTWNSSESENYTVNANHTFTDLSGLFTLTAVLEEIPEGYSYRRGTTNIDDFQSDSAMDWYRNKEYYQPRTNFIIYLDHEYTGNIHTVCEVVDGETGEQIKDVAVSLSEWDDSGELGNCVEWVTTGETDYVDFEYTLTEDSYYTNIQFVADQLPEKYSNYSYCPFLEKRISVDDDDTTVSFSLYLYEDGEDHDYIGDYDTTDTMTTTGIYHKTTTTTTTATTTVLTDIPENFRDCENCGKTIHISQGITTPLGMFVCQECRAMGVGGTTAPHYVQTDTTVITYEGGSTTTTTASTITECKACELCGNIIDVNDGVITPLGLFVCPSCKSAGMGGTRPHFPSDTETTTTTTVNFGDANEDGKVSVADSVFIMQALSNPNEYQLTEQGAKNADVYNNGDGVTAQDALTIQMIDISLISVEDLPVSAE